MSAKLSIEMTELLELFLPIYCIGNLLFEMMIAEDKDFTYSYIGIGIGIIHSMLPM